MAVCTNLFRLGFCKVLADIALTLQVGLYCPVDNLLYTLSPQQLVQTQLLQQVWEVATDTIVVSGTGYTSVKPRSRYRQSYAWV